MKKIMVMGIPIVNVIKGDGAAVGGGLKREFFFPFTFLFFFFFLQKF
jgi:hypothetical protein